VLQDLLPSSLPDYEVGSSPGGTNTAAVARIKEGGGITIGNNHIRAFSKATWGDQLKLTQFG
jgi:hypothetical protein